MTKKLSIEERKSYCIKWRSSELSMVNFCKASNISESALHKWLKLYDSKLLSRKHLKIPPYAGQNFCAIAAINFDQ